MSRIFFIFLISAILSLSTFAQTKPLPANIAKWEDSSEILNNPVIKSRLKKLLGAKSYADFTESWETVNPIVKKGNLLFSSGCLIHACGHIESAIAIDLGTQTIHAAIFRETEKTRFFNEKKRKTPAVIRNWANRLKSNQ
jgi:hypothetical protein